MEVELTKYGEKLRDPRWQRRRLEVMKRDDFKCRLCGDAEHTLNVHHLWYERGADPWDYIDDALITTCETCHEECHLARWGDMILAALVAGGAKLNNLYDVQYGIEMSIMPGSGPDARALNPEEWEAFAGLLAYGLSAIQRGGTEKQIKAALEGIAR
jgi:hypothetical protein